MAAHKCSYLIINNSKQTPTKLKLQLYKTDIEKVECATFLGLEIDDKLKFEQHFNTIKKKCLDRLNIIKITAHKSWQLTTKTLITL
jgi:hypothetical protein